MPEAARIFRDFDLVSGPSLSTILTIVQLSRTMADSKRTKRDHLLALVQQQRWFAENPLPPVEELQQRLREAERERDLAREQCLQDAAAAAQRAESNELFREKLVKELEERGIVPTKEDIAAQKEELTSLRRRLEKSAVHDGKHDGDSNGDGARTATDVVDVDAVVEEEEWVSV